MKKLSICSFAAITFVAASVQAQVIPLSNGDFELPGENSFPDGFDAVPDIPAWQDLTAITDAGVEGSGAWWGTYDESFSVFMAVGDGAYNLSDHIIQAGEEYSVEFVAKTWDAASEWTVSLFYDEPNNVIGTFTTALDGTWTAYSALGAIPATEASVGGTLGISFLNTGQGFANLDNVSISTIPEPSTYALFAGLGALGLMMIRRRLRKA